MESNNGRRNSGSSSSGSGQQGRSDIDHSLSPMSPVKRTPIFQQDYARIDALMKDKPTVMSHLSGLNALVGKGVKLKHALFHTEQQHGFAPQVERLQGGLSSQGEFMGMLGSGRMFKDRSAAPDHGEYTHRLQWHAVAKDMELNPKLYTTDKASDLYRGLAARYQHGQTAKYNWMSLFDHNENTGDFRQPETLTAELKQNNDLPALQSALNTEHAKRKKLGTLDGFKKGKERNEYIQAMQSMEIHKYDGFLALDHVPAQRQEGQQPSTKAFDRVNLVKGGLKKTDL